MIRIFVKKPVEVQAIQWTGKNYAEIQKFVGKDGCYFNKDLPGAKLAIATLEGDHRAEIGDWIIRGVKGEFYPCKPDIFAQTYEKKKE